MKWFIPFLGFIFFGELFANYQYYVLKAQSSIRIYYLISIVESFFYGYIFFNLSSKRIVKLLILFFIGFSELVYLISILVKWENIGYFLFSLIVSGFLLATIAFIYLYTKFDNDDETLLITEPGFWIATGVSLFFSGASISFSLYEVINKYSIHLYGQKLYNLMPQILSIVLYLCISIALFLCKQKNKIL